MSAQDEFPLAVGVLGAEGRMGGFEVDGVAIHSVRLEGRTLLLG